MSNRLFFKKKMRLFTTTYFQKIFNTSQRNITSLITILNINNKLNYPRLGIVVSKKVSKLAYKRNFIKRSIRESFRLCQYNLKCLDFLVIARKQIIKIPRLEIMNFLHHLWIKYYL